jgi:two-component system, OmpR family, sensor histidine kinase KdpD
MRARQSALNWASLQFVLLTCLGAAAIITGLTTVLFLVRAQLGTPVVALLYLLPVGLSALLWGLPAGLTAASGAFLAFNYFFIPPYYSLAVHTPSDLLALVTFFVVATTISQLMGRARARQSEAQAREHDAVHLYELSLALAGQATPEAIARVVADHLHVVFQPAVVEVVIQYEANQTPRLVRLPPGTPPPGIAPEGVVPLMAAKGLIGEIRLWRTTPFTLPAEDRLLRLFANEAALAIERARLSQAETAARVLGESDRLKSALLSSVSHELRTPLATILAAATSLRQGEVAWDSDTRAELLEIMEEEADHLNRLVGNLLDMSRIEAGALQPQRQWNQLSEIVETALARLRRAAEKHTVQIDVPDDLPLVPVDTTLMQQVFVNLLSNSLKFAPAHTLIRVSAEAAEAETLHVQVSNQGPRVAEKDLEHIFDKFYRVTAADRVTGTGLGLSICKGIVEAHGGRLWAENLPAGLAFNFTVPLTWEGSRHPAALPPEEAV